MLLSYLSIDRNKKFIIHEGVIQVPKWNFHVRFWWVHVTLHQSLDAMRHFLCWIWALHRVPRIILTSFLWHHFRVEIVKGILQWSFTCYDHKNFLLIKSLGLKANPRTNVVGIYFSKVACNRMTKKYYFVKYKDTCSYRG